MSLDFADSVLAEAPDAQAAGSNLTRHAARPLPSQIVSDISSEADNEGGSRVLGIVVAILFATPLWALVGFTIVMLLP